MEPGNPIRSVTPERLAPDSAGVARAAALLASGAPVAFPTETVYGLGADATNDRAVAAIFAAKGRPSFNPLIVHVPDEAAARRMADFDPLAERLAGAFWPGPLTLVLPAVPGAMSSLVTAGLPTVAVRVPAHPLAQALLVAVGRPVAAPSANPSGRLSPTDADAVAEGLGDRVAAILDGGRCPVGVESTIVGLANGKATLLRPGGLPREALEACLGESLRMPPAGASPTAPGQLASHYAPRAALRLEAERAEAGEVLLGFGRVDSALNLSPSGDLIEAAANLFGHLRALDARGAARIAVSPIPRHGLGLAINDRLARAAAPRAP